MFSEEFWVETDIAWFVDTMDVSETGGNGEVWADCRKSAVNIPNIFWLSVQGSIVDTSVINTYRSIF